MLYIAPTEMSQARVLKMWAPFIDTAFHVSAYRISDFQVLDDYVTFFERTIRKTLGFVDLLSLNISKNLREEDKRYVRHLLESRAQKGKLTVVNMVPKDLMVMDGYREFVDVRE